MSGEPILRTELEPESPERLDTFLTKWHAHDCLSLHELSTRRGMPCPSLLNNCLFNSFLFSLPEDTLKCLALHPTPKFQLLCLRDLPPELIHYIMDIAGVDGARRLGATCRLLREISSSYIFEVLLRPYQAHDYLLTWYVLASVVPPGFYARLGSGPLHGVH